MAQQTGFVVVGYGMGAYHARLIDAVDELTLLGVCDVDAEKRAKAQAAHPGIREYSGFQDVLTDGDVDAVVIVTPHNTHAELAIAAMNAGKHVITDKAMCLSVSEAREMIAARDRNGVLLSVFHNRRWDSDFVTVRKILAERLLGPVYHIQSNVTSYGIIGGWRGDRAAMGGWLFDWGAHTLDQFLLLERSRPVRVHAFDHYRHSGATTVEEYVNATVTFESGLTASTVVSYLHRLPMPRWHIIGRDAALVGEDFEKPLRVKGIFSGIDGEMSIPLIKSDWKSFYQNIADALAGRAELEVKPEQVVPQIAIAEAAYRSINTKQVVDVDVV